MSCLGVRPLHLTLRSIGILIAMCSGLALPSPSHAETRALLIGIDRYEHVSSLDGAVADAEDIASALHRLGVKDLLLLRNEEADRATLDRAWTALVDRAQPGDQIILTYAGHGSQLPDSGADAETDGMDEFLLLPEFDVRGPGARERLLDDELNVWFQQAAAKGVQVLAAIDACHSGTAFRRLNFGPKTTKERYVELPADIVLPRIDVPGDLRAIERDELENLTFISGAQDDETVPELLIPDREGRPQKRGAMSWSFARAFEGAADVDQDGILRRGELYDFVQGKVREFAESRQTPNFWPSSLRDLGLLRLAGAEAFPDGAPLDEPLRLAVVGGIHPS